MNSGFNNIFTRVKCILLSSKEVVGRIPTKWKSKHALVKLQLHAKKMSFSFRIQSPGKTFYHLQQMVRVSKIYERTDIVSDAGEDTFFEQFYRTNYIKKMINKEEHERKDAYLYLPCVVLDWLF